MMLIVVPPKRVDLLLRVLERREPMDVQALLSKPAIEGFDRGVVRRLAAAAEVEDDAVGVRPEVHRGADELGAVVAVDPLWQSALESHALERGGDLVPPRLRGPGCLGMLVPHPSPERDRPKTAVVPRLGEEVLGEHQRPDYIRGFNS
jgi:hypothetical protein